MTDPHALGRRHADDYVDDGPLPELDQRRHEDDLQAAVAGLAEDARARFIAAYAAGLDERTRERMTQRAFANLPPDPGPPPRGASRTQLEARRHWLARRIEAQAVAELRPGEDTTLSPEMMALCQERAWLDVQLDSGSRRLTPRRLAVLVALAAFVLLVAWLFARR